VLKPAGISYEGFKAKGILRGNWTYKSYEGRGFSTPSKKVELYSSRFREWGYDPLPSYREDKNLAMDFQSDQELILTSAKDPNYFHSAYRNLPSLRKLSPDPVVLLHPDTAAKLKIREGDWAIIEAATGKIRQKVVLDKDLHPRVVVAAYGWWFPERKDLELSGWKESNINILTASDPPYDPTIGTTNLRAIPCRIYKDQ
jgi:anaerobic selenocysteine-containing dehydrogenase